MTTSRGPGIIVIQEWWGVVPHILDVAKRFEKEGFVTHVPDLYHGERASKPDEAGRLMMALNIEQAARDLEEAAKKLLTNPNVTSKKVGVVGFCMGGQLALYAASLTPTMGACVDFYGIHPNVTPEYSKIRCPVLGLFGKRDEFITPEKVSALKAELEKAGVTHTFHTYDAPHAFFNNERPEVYNPEAAADAWEKTLTFFRENLS